MATGSRELVSDGWGGTYFDDAGLERQYQEYSVTQSLGASKYTPWIAAALFIASGPFDYVLIGNFTLSELAVQCFVLRAATVFLLVLSGLYIRTASPKGKSVTLILGWVFSVAVIWYLAMLATPFGAVFYIALFGLASLSTISLVPVLTFWQVRIMNVVLFVPFMVIAMPILQTGAMLETAYLVFSGFILLSTIFMGLYSKRSYEMAMRADFLRSRDLVEARDAAAKADSAKTDFLASASHELRTPLNAIVGNLQLIAKSRRLTIDEREMLKDARKASDTMTAMVNALLKVTSVTTQPRVAVSDIRLGELIADIEAVVGVLATQKSLRLSLPGKEIRDLWVRVDVENLRQILLNLLGNAVKFTRLGHVGLRLRVTDHRLRFLVHDSGVGMPPDQARRAFEPLFRATNVAASEFPGTGLGLAIVDRLVAESGGSIRLLSLLDKGTVVAGWLPSLAVSPVISDSRELAPAHVTPIQVLVIEDDPASMAVLTRMLEQAGHSVRGAKTGAEAIRMFEAAPPDCVLSDIRLPDINGVELLQQLTALSQSSELDSISFFAVTANAFRDDLTKYNEAGFDGVISKPFEEATLLSYLEGVAAKRRMLTLLDNAGACNAMDPDTENRETALYFSSLRECITLLRRAGKENDMDGVEAIAHRIRGTALVFGDIETADYARRFEFHEGFGDDAAMDAVSAMEDALLCVLRQETNQNAVAEND